MSTQSVSRPASVSFVVVLTWIVAILTIIASGILLFTSDQTLTDAGVDPAPPDRSVGWSRSVW